MDIGYRDLADLVIAIERHAILSARPNLAKSQQLFRISRAVRARLFMHEGSNACRQEAEMQTYVFANQKGGVGEHPTRRRTCVLTWRR